MMGRKGEWEWKKEGKGQEENGTTEERGPVGREARVDTGEGYISKT